MALFSVCSVVMFCICAHLVRQSNRPFSIDERACPCSLLVWHVETASFARVTEHGQQAGHRRRMVANTGDNRVISKMRALMSKDVNPNRPRYAV